jgi:hypothetical protein
MPFQTKTESVTSYLNGEKAKDLSVYKYYRRVSQSLPDRGPRSVGRGSSQRSLGFRKALAPVRAMQNYSAIGVVDFAFGRLFVIQGAPQRDFRWNYYVHRTAFNPFPSFRCPLLAAGAK